jgi:hypothetical protein
LLPIAAAVTSYLEAYQVVNEQVRRMRRGRVEILANCLGGNRCAGVCYRV